MNSQSILSLLLISTLFIASCNDDDPTPENPEELITTLLIHVVPHSGGTQQTFQFLDLDGDGGNPPIIIGGTLAANSEYHATLMLQDGTVDPPEDINEEILAEDEAHQFFFSFKGIDVTHAYDDMDSNGNPIGIVNTWMTGATPGTGTLSVVLRHEPNKSGVGVADGDITNAGGDTDIEVTFPVIIQ
jgi:hypothetical protein